MTALKTLGVICIILACMAPVITLVTDSFTENKKAKVNSNGQRELKINRLSYWDYLILIISICLLLIGLFSSDIEERRISFMILGIGYMMLILSSYNRRIDIPKINWFILSINLLSAATGYLLKSQLPNYTFSTGFKSLNTLYFPLLAYLYLQTGRFLIKHFTNTYPITLDKNYRVGRFHNRYGRKTNNWDFLWTMASFLVIPIILYLLR